MGIENIDLLLKLARSCGMVIVMDPVTGTVKEMIRDIGYGREDGPRQTFMRVVSDAELFDCLP